MQNYSRNREYYKRRVGQVEPSKEMESKDSCFVDDFKRENQNKFKKTKRVWIYQRNGPQLE